MNLTKEFVEQLEEIDKYTEENKFNHITGIVLNQLRKDFVDSYLASMMNTTCTHDNIIDEGYFNYKNNMFVEDDIENAKYHKYFCPTCNTEIVYENTSKKLIKSK